MMSFVREKKWMGVGLSVIRRGPDNASEVCAKWRDHKMSGFGPPEVGTSLTLPLLQGAQTSAHCTDSSPPLGPCAIVGGSVSEARKPGVCLSHACLQKVSLDICLKKHQPPPHQYCSLQINRLRPYMYV